LRFVRRSKPVQGAYLIDVNAMVFGMPRALFPALAATVFGGGATTVGLLYAAPGAGALIGALTSGWVGRVRGQGRAVVLAVLLWGAAIAGFGLVRWLPLALLLLAVAGWADVVSAVFRNTIIQFAGPDGMRGRLMGVQMAVVAGGPRLGDLEAGAVATAFGDTVSVVSGGLACIAGCCSPGGCLGSPGSAWPCTSRHRRPRRTSPVRRPPRQPPAPPRLRWRPRRTPPRRPRPPRPRPSRRPSRDSRRARADRDHRTAGP
jgi:MFS family permease